MHGGSTSTNGPSPGWSQRGRWRARRVGGSLGGTSRRQPDSVASLHWPYHAWILSPEPNPTLSGRPQPLPASSETSIGETAYFPCKSGCRGTHVAQSDRDGEGRHRERRAARDRPGLVASRPGYEKRLCAATFGKRRRGGHLAERSTDALAPWPGSHEHVEYAPQRVAAPRGPPRWRTCRWD
jgi:hypothetical protein